MASDFSSIRDEDLLRQMWQQTEDFGRKKEIRAHMYRLRETRLRDFYIGDMDSGIGLTKTPLTGSHGDSLADQSFQSFKTKEIRDSESPTRDYRFGVVTTPDTSGWNMVTSSERSADGKTHTTHSLATTGGVQELPGGKAAFTGCNEHMTKDSYDGDDRNFTASSGQTSKTCVEENTVTGDERNGTKIENKSSSVTSSSRVIQSKITTGDEPVFDHRNVGDDFDNIYQRTRNVINTNDQNTQNTNYNINRETHNQNLTSNVKTSTTQSTNEVRTRQQEAERLFALPGVITSRRVEYPDANTKRITETKKLDDGTTVTTTKYETKSATSQSWSTASNQKASTTSRVVTEDRVNSNKVESIKDDKRHPTTDNYNNLRRHVDSVDPRNDTNVTKIIKTTTRNKKDDDIRDTVTTTRKIYTTDENLYDNDSVDFIETHHQTVKKDLSQDLRDGRYVINKDFIDIEKNYIRDPQREPKDGSTPQGFIQILRENRPADQMPTQHPKYNDPNGYSPKDSFPQTKEPQNNSKIPSKNEYQPSQKDTRPHSKEPQETHPKYNQQQDTDYQPFQRETYPKSKDPQEYSQQPKYTRPSERGFEPQDAYQSPREQQAPNYYNNVKDKPFGNVKPLNKTLPKDERPDYETTTKEHTIIETVLTDKKVQNDHKRTEYVSKRISVDLDATHNAFANSLRCTSPVDRGSVRSFRNSNNSVRSSSSPDKSSRSHRSPSRESITYSESSRISSNTITKSRDSTRDLRRPIIGTPERKTSPAKKPQYDREDSPDKWPNSRANDVLSKIKEHTATKKTSLVSKSKDVPKKRPNDDTDKPNAKTQEKPTDKLLKKNPTDDDNMGDVSKQSRPVDHRKHSFESPTKDTPIPKAGFSSERKPDQFVPSKNSPLPRGISPAKSTKKTPSDNYTSTVTIDTTNTTFETKHPTKKQPREPSDADSLRSVSPTTTVSDIEYIHHPTINNRHIITDLDSEDNVTVTITLENLDDVEDITKTINEFEITGRKKITKPRDDFIQTEKNICEKETIALRKPKLNDKSIPLPRKTGSTKTIVAEEITTVTGRKSSPVKESRDGSPNKRPVSKTPTKDSKRPRKPEDDDEFEPENYDGKPRRREPTDSLPRKTGTTKTIVTEEITTVTGRTTSPVKGPRDDSPNKRPVSKKPTKDSTRPQEPEDVDEFEPEDYDGNPRRREPTDSLPRKTGTTKTSVTEEITTVTGRKTSPVKESRDGSPNKRPVSKTPTKDLTRSREPEDVDEFEPEVYDGKPRRREPTDSLPRKTGTTKTIVTEEINTVIGRKSSPVKEPRDDYPNKRPVSKTPTKDSARPRKPEDVDEYEPEDYDGKPRRREPTDSLPRKTGTTKTIVTEEITTVTGRKSSPVKEPRDDSPNKRPVSKTPTKDSTRPREPEDVDEFEPENYDGKPRRREPTDSLPRKTGTTKTIVTEEITTVTGRKTSPAKEPKDDSPNKRPVSKTPTKDSTRPREPEDVDEFEPENYDGKPRRREPTDSLPRKTGTTKTIVTEEITTVTGRKSSPVKEPRDDSPNKRPVSKTPTKDSTRPQEHEDVDEFEPEDYDGKPRRRGPTDSLPRKTDTTKTIVTEEITTVTGRKTSPVKEPRDDYPNTRPVSKTPTKDMTRPQEPEDDHEVEPENYDDKPRRREPTDSLPRKTGTTKTIVTEEITTVTGRELSPVKEPRDEYPNKRPVSKTPTQDSTRSREPEDVDEFEPEDNDGKPRRREPTDSLPRKTGTTKTIVTEEITTVTGRELSPVKEPRDEYPNKRPVSKTPTQDSTRSREPEDVDEFEPEDYDGKPRRREPTDSLPRKTGTTKTIVTEEITTVTGRESSPVKEPIDDSPNKRPVSKTPTKDSTRPREPEDVDEFEPEDYDGKPRRREPTDSLPRKTDTTKTIVTEEITTVTGRKTSPVKEPRDDYPNTLPVSKTPTKDSTRPQEPEDDHEVEPEDYDDKPGRREPTDSLPRKTGTTKTIVTEEITTVTGRELSPVKEPRDEYPNKRPVSKTPIQDSTRPREPEDVDEFEPEDYDGKPRRREPTDSLPRKTGTTKTIVTEEITTVTGRKSSPVKEPRDDSPNKRPVSKKPAQDSTRPQEPEDVDEFEPEDYDGKPRRREPTDSLPRKTGTTKTIVTKEITTVIGRKTSPVKEPRDDYPNTRPVSKTPTKDSARLKEPEDVDEFEPEDYDGKPRRREPTDSLPRKTGTTKTIVTEEITTVIGRKSSPVKEPRDDSPNKRPVSKKPTQDSTRPQEPEDVDEFEPEDYDGKPRRREPTDSLPRKTGTTKTIVTEEITTVTGRKISPVKEPTDDYPNTRPVSKTTTNNLTRPREPVDVDEFEPEIYDDKPRRREPADSLPRKTGTTKTIVTDEITTVVGRKSSPVKEPRDDSPNKRPVSKKPTQDSTRPQEPEDVDEFEPEDYDGKPRRREPTDSLPRKTGTTKTIVTEEITTVTGRKTSPVKEPRDDYPNTRPVSKTPTKDSTRPQEPEDDHEVEPEDYDGKPRRREQTDSLPRKTGTTKTIVTDEITTVVGRKSSPVKEPRDDSPNKRPVSKKPTQDSTRPQEPEDVDEFEPEDYDGNPRRREPTDSLPRKTGTTKTIVTEEITTVTGRKISPVKEPTDDYPNTRPVSKTPTKDLTRPREPVDVDEFEPEDYDGKPRRREPTDSLPRKTGTTKTIVTEEITTVTGRKTSPVKEPRDDYPNTRPGSKTPTKDSTRPQEPEDDHEVEPEDYDGKPRRREQTDSLPRKTGTTKTIVTEEINTVTGRKSSPVKEPRDDSPNKRPVSKTPTKDSARPRKPEDDDKFEPENYDGKPRRREPTDSLPRKTGTSKTIVTEEITTVTGRKSSPVKEPRDDSPNKRPVSKKPTKDLTRPREPEDYDEFEPEDYDGKPRRREPTDSLPRKAGTTKTIVTEEITTVTGRKSSPVKEPRDDSPNKRPVSKNPTKYLTRSREPEDVDEFEPEVYDGKPRRREPTDSLPRKTGTTKTIVTEEINTVIGRKSSPVKEPRDDYPNKRPVSKTPTKDSARPRKPEDDDKFEPENYDGKPRRREPTDSLPRKTGTTKTIVTEEITTVTGRKSSPVKVARDDSPNKRPVSKTPTKDSTRPREPEDYDEFEPEVYDGKPRRREPTDSLPRKTGTTKTIVTEEITTVTGRKTSPVKGPRDDSPNKRPVSKTPTKDSARLKEPEDVDEFEPEDYDGKLRRHDRADYLPRKTGTTKTIVTEEITTVTGRKSSPVKEPRDDSPNKRPVSKTSTKDLTRPREPEDDEEFEPEDYDGKPRRREPTDSLPRKTGTTKTIVTEEITSVTGRKTSPVKEPRDDSSNKRPISKTPTKDSTRPKGPEDIDEFEPEDYDGKPRRREPTDSLPRKTGTTKTIVTEKISKVPKDKIPLKNIPRNSEPNIKIGHVITDEISEINTGTFTRRKTTDSLNHVVLEEPDEQVCPIVNDDYSSKKPIQVTPKTMKTNVQKSVKKHTEELIQIEKNTFENINSLKQSSLKPKKVPKNSDGETESDEHSNNPCEIETSVDDETEEFYLNQRNSSKPETSDILEPLSPSESSSVPRKSSLKKTVITEATYKITGHPQEDKPIRNIPREAINVTHKTVSTNDNSEPNNQETKQRPPFVRSETFEERCRMILGMPIPETQNKPDIVTREKAPDSPSRTTFRDARRKFESEFVDVTIEDIVENKKTKDFISIERENELRSKQTIDESTKRRPEYRSSGRSSPVDSTASDTSPERKKSEDRFSSVSTETVKRRPNKEPVKQSKDIGTKQPCKRSPESSPERKNKYPSNRRPTPIYKQSEEIFGSTKTRPSDKLSPRNVLTTINTPGHLRPGEQMPSNRKPSKPDIYDGKTASNKPSPTLNRQTPDVSPTRKATPKKLFKDDINEISSQVSETVTEVITTAKEMIVKQLVDQTTPHILKPNIHDDEKPKRPITKTPAPDTLHKSSLPSESNIRTTNITKATNAKTKNEIKTSKLTSGTGPVTATTTNTPRKAFTGKVINEKQTALNTTNKLTIKAIETMGREVVDIEYISEPETVSEPDDYIVKSEFNDIEESITSVTVVKTKTPGRDRKEHTPNSVNKLNQRSPYTSTNVPVTPKSSKPIQTPSKVIPVDKKIPSPKTRPTKHIATKTINLTPTTLIHPVNEYDDNNDVGTVIIDIQHAQSSREVTPNRMVPMPVSPDEDMGVVRYPDTVHEPDDDIHKSLPKIKNIPIYEEEANDYIGCHITEVYDETTTQSYKSSKHRIVEDESLLSVSDKVNKFIQAAEKLTSPTTKEPKTRLTKPENVDEKLKSDECLLSVSDKVSKFTLTAEVARLPKPSAPFEPEDEDNDYYEPEPDVSRLSVTEKVTKFITTAEDVKKTKTTLTPNSPTKLNEKVTKLFNVTQEPRAREPAQFLPAKLKTERPKNEKTDDNLPQDDCLLSVSDKVTKFITTAEKLVATVPQKSPELVAKMERQVSRRERIPSASDNHDSPPQSPRGSITDRYVPKERSPISTVTTPQITLRSTEAIKKAKAVFENRDNRTPSTQPKQIDILSRPSVWEGRQSKPDIPAENQSVTQKKPEKIEQFDEKPDTKTPRNVIVDENVTPKKSEKVPSYLRDTVSTKKDIFEKKISSTNFDMLPENMDIINKKIATLTKETTKPIVKTTMNSRPKDHTPTNKVGQVEPKSSESYPSQTTIIRVPKAKTPNSKEPWSSRSNELQSPDDREPVHEEMMTKVTKEFIHCDCKPTAPQHKNHGHTHSREFVPEQHMRPQVHEIMSSKTIISDKRLPFERSETSSPAREMTTPDRHRPSYMSHTVSSLEHIRRESIESNRIVSSRRESLTTEEVFEEYEEPLSDGNPRSGIKFGVELKHSDSDNQKRRKSSSSEIPHIEEIFDLELLEKMLETVVGYEQRRRIRSQIRVVKTKQNTKQLGSTTTTTTFTKTTHETPRHKQHPESPMRMEIISSSKYPTERKSSPTRKEVVEDVTYHITPRTSKKYNTNTQEFMESEISHITKHERNKKMTPRSPSPPKDRKSLIKDDKCMPKDTNGNIDEDKPIWATKNILKKVTETTRNFKSPTSVTKKPLTPTSSKPKTRPTDSVDAVTSSYGVGPTDENGKPLFGIRALKKKTTTSTSVIQPIETQVTETVVTEEETLFTENGKSPVGQRTVTVYTNKPGPVSLEQINAATTTNKSPREIREKLMERENSRKNLTSSSVTTTSTKSNNFYKEIIDNTDITTEETDDIEDDYDIIDQLPKRTVIRRGSVKELSEKFIQKETTDHRTTTQTTGVTGGSYPKAGLILRTQTQNQTSRSSTPGASSVHSGSAAEFDEYDVEVRTQTTTLKTPSKTERTVITKKHIISDDSSENRRSFLNTNDKVSGINDVIDRMRNADNVEEDGDTTEDREARALLNKFLGASVLMSGCESMASNLAKTSSSTTTKTSQSKTNKHIMEPTNNNNNQGYRQQKTTIVKSLPGVKQQVTTRVTKTVKSTPTTTSTTHVTLENFDGDIDEIWDEHLLKEILEQTTNYDDRRKIRSKIRQIMADKEACKTKVVSPLSSTKTAKTIASVDQHQPAVNNSKTIITAPSTTVVTTAPINKGIVDKHTTATKIITTTTSTTKQPIITTTITTNKIINNNNSCNVDGNTSNNNNNIAKSNKNNSKKVETIITNYKVEEPDDEEEEEDDDDVDDDEEEVEEEVESVGDDVEEEEDDEEEVTASEEEVEEDEEDEEEEIEEIVKEVISPNKSIVPIKVDKKEEEKVNEDNESDDDDEEYEEIEEVEESTGDGNNNKVIKTTTTSTKQISDKPGVESISTKTIKIQTTSGTIITSGNKTEALPVTAVKTIAPVTVPVLAIKPPPASTPVKTVVAAVPTPTVIVASTTGKTSSVVQDGAVSQGESLLLPLLQGLLQKKTVPTAYNASATTDSTQTAGSVAAEELSLPVEDSGTESGEDLKLLAAGIHDSIEMHRGSGDGGGGGNGKGNLRIRTNSGGAVVGLGLLAEVTAALERLESSLRDGNDIELDTSKRDALLSLVSRLQTGLISPDKITASTPAPGLLPAELSSPEAEARMDLGRRSSGQGRFAKRRNRQNRHTVGVSREELADARRLMEEIVMRESLSNCATPDSSQQVTPQEFPYALQKQESAAAVLSAVEPATTILFRPNQFVPKEMLSSQKSIDGFKFAPKFPKLSIDTKTPSPETSMHSAPVVHMRERKPKFKFMRQSYSLEQPVKESDSAILQKVNQMPPTGYMAASNKQPRPLSEGSALESTEILDNNPLAAVSSKSVPDISSDEEVNTMSKPLYKVSELAAKLDKKVMEKNWYNKIHHGNPKPFSFPKVENKVCYPVAAQPKPGPVIKAPRIQRSQTPPAVKSKPIDDITVPKSTSQRLTLNSEMENSNSNEKQSNKYNAKKIKMKRANTIDIPKSFSFANGIDGYESESDEEELCVNQPKNEKHSTIGLKSTVNAPDKKKSNKKMPNFKPKTENDLKFLAFIQKQNSANSGTWVNPAKEMIAAQASLPPSVQQISMPSIRNQPVKQNWTNKFGNIKNTFESGYLSGGNEMKPPKPALNAARTFWKSTDKDNMSSLPARGPIFSSFGSTGNLSNVDKQNKIVKYPWADKVARASSLEDKSNMREFMSGKYTPPAAPKFNESYDPPKITREPNPIVIPQPIPVNKFSHAPMSAFKPIPKKILPPTFKPIEPELKSYQLPYPNNLPKPPMEQREPADLYQNYKSKSTMQPEKHHIKSPIIPPPWASPVELVSPTRNIAASFIQSTATQPKSPTVGLPWANRISSGPESRVLNIAKSNFDASQKKPGKISPRGYNLMSQSMKYKSEKPLTGIGGPMNTGSSHYKSNRILEKRPSLPNTAIYSPHYSDNIMLMSESDPTYKNTHFNENLFAQNYNQQNIVVKPKLPEINSVPTVHRQMAPATDEFPAYTYTCTDYTLPSCVSTYIPQLSVTDTSGPSLDSILGEPLVLSNTRPIISPSQKSSLSDTQQHLYIDFPSPQSPASPQKLSAASSETDEFDGNDSTEYKAVSSKVMRGPVQQSAVTVSHKTSRVGDEGSQSKGKGSQEAKDLHSLLKKLTVNSVSKSPSPSAKSPQPRTGEPLQSAPVAYPKPQMPSANESNYTIPEQQQPITFNPPQIIETPSTPIIQNKIDAPAHIVYNNVNAFPVQSQRSAYSQVDPNLPRYYPQPPPPSVAQSQGVSRLPPTNYYRDAGITSPLLYQSYQPPLYASPLSKSDSWHQICEATTKPPSPKFNFAPNEGGRTMIGLQRARSGHNLTVPKQYEAGISKREIIEKQNKVAAYFAGSGQKSPQNVSAAHSTTNHVTSSTSSAHHQQQQSLIKKSTKSINRLKTNEKASIETTTKTETKEKDGATVTKTTTTVTTQRSIGGSGGSGSGKTITPITKPISPFAKFRQLDKQNPTQSPPNSPLTPSTPKSPGGTPASPLIFKFTDPALNRRAATVKDQLLQWCQMKTREYENIKIDNFSTSWSDGLAFCALIHHFYPDAFDFTKLTPKQRRHNFDLAFRVAEDKAGIAPLLDVEDMVVMRKPDWKCVFTYVQSIWRRFRDVE